MNKRRRRSQGRELMCLPDIRVKHLLCYSVRLRRTEKDSERSCGVVVAVVC